MSSRTRVAALALAALVSLSLLPAAARAQQSPQMTSDAVARDYFPPRLVLAYAEEIGLTEEQRELIDSESRAAQDSFLELRLELEDEVRRLIGLSNLHPVDEEAVVEQLEAILGLEHRIKVLQARLLVRVKNALTEEQHDELRRIRRQGRSPRQ